MGNSKLLVSVFSSLPSYIFCNPSKTLCLLDALRLSLLRAAREEQDKFLAVLI